MQDTSTTIEPPNLGAATQIPSELCRALAYIRVSGMSQSDKDGPVRQELAINGYAEAHRFEIVGVYRELGVSGTIANAQRPEWTRMISDARALGVRHVIVEKLDRLSRDLLEQEVALRDLVAARITLLSSAEADVMATDATRVLFRQLVGAIAQYDRAQTVAKLAEARARIRAAGGRCDGRLRYGSKPGEHEVILKMQALRGSGMAYGQIAARLNSEGVRSRAGRWHSYSVNRVLSQARGASGARKAPPCVVGHGNPTVLLSIPSVV